MSKLCRDNKPRISRPVFGNELLVLAIPTPVGESEFPRNGCWGPHYMIMSGCKNFDVELRGHKCFGATRQSRSELLSLCYSSSIAALWSKLRDLQKPRIVLQPRENRLN